MSPAPTVEPADVQTEQTYNAEELQKKVQFQFFIRSEKDGGAFLTPRYIRREMIL